MRASVTMTIAAASQRNAGSGRFSLTQAAAGDISASAIVSQPFSSAKVSASASAASVPVAKIALAAGRPGRGARCTSASVATAKIAASNSASPAKGSDRSSPATR